MEDYQMLNHIRWYCRYHVVFIPKRGKKAMYEAIRKHLGEVFQELARLKEYVKVEAIDVGITSTYACACERDRIHQEEERYFDGEQSRRQTERLHGREFLGTV